MLKYRSVWLALGIGWVALVVYLSLADLHLPQTPVRWFDKVNHLLAYGFLMGWFGQLYLRWKSRLVLVFLLIGLGVAMELLQGQLPYRWFEIADAIANAVGVLLAWICLRLGGANILVWFERRFLKTLL